MKLFLSSTKFSSIALLLLSLFLLLANSIKAQSHTNTLTSNGFIMTSCGVTLYPKLCYKTLVAYASTIQSSPMEMANTALNISLNHAKITSNTVLGLSKRRGLSPRDAGPILDCVEIIGDSVDELKKSLLAMSGFDGPDFEFKLSNIQTWVSAALTDDDTCMDSFEEKGKNVDANIKGIIRSSILEVAQFTSISLALINKIP